MILTSTLRILFILFILSSAVGQAQDVTGFWLGITYTADPNQAQYNYSLDLTQNGSLLSGTTNTARPNSSFGGLAYLSGQITSTGLSFSETDINGSTAVPNICFWRGTLTYNPTNESLTGTYETIPNGTTCKDAESGKVELYRVVVKSDTKFCKGSPVNVVVTGKNIRWYESPVRANPVGQGNTFSPNITQTTTFYLTQTLYNNESPVIPITIEITESEFTATPVNPDCSSTSGAIALSSVGSTGWQYSLNGGPFQTTPLFGGLVPGTYTVTATNATGCRAQQTVTLTTQSGPTISDLQVTPPRCGSANGEVSVVGVGGKAPLTYSNDYGQTFQSSPLFSKLSGGTYTFRVRDASGCEVNRALSLPETGSMTVLSATGLPTMCGQANGQVSMTTSGGISPVQYSLDNQTFQSTNTFTDLKAGDYTLLARDREGCTVSQTISVAASTGPQLADVQITAEGCGQQNGAILISTALTPGITDYSIDGQTFQRTLTFSGLKAGAYVLTTKDSDDCRVTQNVVLPSLNCGNYVNLPTAFSPNADHVNDALTVHFAFSSLAVSRFTVYDRWGAVLYNRTNFELATGDSIWDGQVNGQAAPAGVYGYHLECQLPDGTQTSYRESVVLLNQ